MADETTQFILGDAAVDALGQPPKRRFFRRRKKRHDQPLTNCENCGAALAGNYCAQCGQHAIDYRRSLLRVLVDAADSFFNWDTKFLKSVGILLVRPWRLTNDFNAGKRVRYVHPLRLYLLASIAFFLIAKLLNFNTNDLVKFDANDREEIATALGKLAAPESGLDDAERARVEEARAKITQLDGNLSEKDKARMQAALGTLIASSVKQSFKEKDKMRLNKALDRLNAVNPVPPPPAPAVEPPPPAPGVEPPPPSVIGPDAGTAVVPPATPSATAEEHGPGFSYKGPGEKDEFGRWIEGRIKDPIGENGTKSKLFLETLRNNIPSMMLCCVPLFAFVLKVLYFRQRRYYVEHLVYALHIHTFAYVAAVLITLIGMAGLRWFPSFQPVLVTLLSFVAVGLVFVSIRRVYRQGWFLTTFKFLLGSFAYLIVLVCAVGVTAFITLMLPS